MNDFNRSEHWENIYTTKKLEEVSWYQPIPTTSLEIINSFHLPKTAKIIDVGGGDSFLVDNLLENGFTDITVLDVSQNALLRAKERLGEKANAVKWILTDAAAFNPPEKYDLWHDRAAFHFLIRKDEIASYVNAAQNGVAENGKMIIATFSEEGPEKCSGIEIKQYGENTLPQMFEAHFDNLNCKTVNHPTPSGKVQNFLFCSFQKR